ncbi:hypothetical protein ACWD01_25170 [Streptomyces sp. NPDC002835]|jgi:hypothetical protein
MSQSSTLGMNNDSVHWWRTGATRHRVASATLGRRGSTLGKEPPDRAEFAEFEVRTLTGRPGALTARPATTCPAAGVRCVR